jgi:hypothetical protein
MSGGRHGGREKKGGPIDYELKESQYIIKEYWIDPCLE